MLTPKERETFAFEIMEELRRWSGVEIRPHASASEPGESDGVEFRLYGRQIGHVHGDCQVHLSLTKALKAHVLEEQLAEHLSMASGSSWAMFTPMTVNDAEHAIWLLRLNYVRLRRQRMEPDAAASNEQLQKHEAELASVSARTAAEVQRTRARAHPRPLPSLDGLGTPGSSMTA